MRIGFHLSISKGFDWTLAEAKRLGCEAVQIFVKNPRSWERKEWRYEDLEGFNRLATEMTVYAHLSYLPNLAKIDEDERSIEGFLNEAALCERAGITHLVVHPGSRRERRRGIEMTAKAINIVHERYGITVLVENTSGQGNVIGRDADELAGIFAGIKDRSRIMFCIDTAHLFESGCDIRKKANWESFIGKLVSGPGIDRIGLFHLNDSKTKTGTRADRHWHIGRGEIGTGFFKLLINDKRFAHLAGIMETPKMGNMDEENMDVMRSLLSPLVSRSSS